MSVRASTDSAHDHDSLRVLVVEDNPGDVRLIRELLSDSGDRQIGLDCAATLADARARLDGDEFDLMLLDLGLPDSSGLETLIQLQSVAARTPIVVLTGSSDQDLAVRCVRLRAQDYLVKGRIDGRDLIRVIHQAIERRRVQASESAEWQRVNDELLVNNHNLERLVNVDPLTDVLNRRGMARALRSELSRVRRGEATLMACMIDCDDFKSVNEAWGHDAGDAVLRELAQRISDSLRPSDHVARIGGDEFLVLLPNAHSEEALRIAERLRTAIDAAPFSHTRGVARVTVSIGVTRLSTEHESIEDVFAAVDSALRASKLGGKNRVTTENTDAPRATRAHTQAELEALMAPGGLRAVCMPILRLADGSVVGYELLTRGTIEGLEQPDTIFRLARQFKRLAQIDVHCLRSCLQAAAKLDRSRGERIYVNLFPSTLLRTSVDELLLVLLEFELVKNTCLELNEHDFGGDLEVIRHQIERLRRHGITIALDDVGAGISPIENLIALEPEYVKLDARIVRGCSNDPVRRRQVTRLADVGFVLGAEVVAEGVEHVADVAFLRSLGVTMAQGFLWGEPRGVEHFAPRR